MARAYRERKREREEGHRFLEKKRGKKEGGRGVRAKGVEKTKFQESYFYARRTFLHPLGARRTLYRKDVFTRPVAQVPCSGMVPWRIARWGTRSRECGERRSDGRREREGGERKRKRRKGRERERERGEENRTRNRGSS